MFCHFFSKTCPSCIHVCLYVVPLSYITHAYSLTPSSAVNLCVFVLVCRKRLHVMLWFMIAVEWHAWLAGWAVLVWMAARAKQHKVEIPAIDWLAFHQGQSLCLCDRGRRGGRSCIMGVFCLCVHLSIVNRSADSGVSGASRPLSCELISRLRLWMWVCRGGGVTCPTFQFVCLETSWAFVLNFQQI